MNLRKTFLHPIQMFLLQESVASFPKKPSTVAIINASQTEYPVFAAAAPVSTIIPDPTIFPTVSQTNADVSNISFSFFPINLSLSLR